MIKLNIYNFFTILLFLIPIALITGPFLPDLFLSLLAIFGLIKLIKSKKIINFFKNPFIAIMAAFYLYILVNSLTTNFIYHSLEHSLFYLRYIFFIFAIYILYQKTNSILEKFCTIIISHRYLYL